MIYHVDASARRAGNGSEDAPFKTISAAAAVARPGDEVLVAPGIYREYVDPKNGGTETERIVYRSTEPRGAHITGAEPVKDWEKVEGDVWRARIPNSLFGDYNPYTTLVSGDWFIATMIAHTGDVYLDGKSLYEVTSLDRVKAPEKSRESWDPDFSLYTWYTEQDKEADETVIFANFQGKDPNAENVEIAVRRNCFYPSAEGKGFITLSGFTVSQAATQWAPPTAYQEGMVGPHWSKGWIIEDCEICESKCCGISLGKYLQPNNDNKWLKWKYKDGTQTERDCICQASYEGWDKEHIGSHVVRRCDIHHCGQTGIVGHLGGVFSLIEDNHIHHVNNKRNLAGAEIGGIKMHAAIDVVIRRNHIHDCTRGIWLDWQAQGTRVSQNLFHDNCLPRNDLEPGGMMFSALGEDLFIEVSHGPTLVDNNIFLSDRAVKLCAQGVALVHNLLYGSLCSVGYGTDNGSAGVPSPRYTPYHAVHGTQVAGFMTILHGDDRFYNNIFIQKPKRPSLAEAERIMGSDGNGWDNCNLNGGTYMFDPYPTREEWESWFEGYCGMGSDNVHTDRYYDHLPVWAAGNAYLGGAKPWSKEKDAFMDGTPVRVELSGEDGRLVLKTDVYEKMKGQAPCAVVSTATLGEAFEPEQRFENPDGSPITFDADLNDVHRSVRTLAGPFAEAGESFPVGI